MDVLSFFTWQFTLLFFTIFGCTYFFRKIVEFFLEKTNTSKTAAFWREVVLPLFPILFAVIFTRFAKTYPYPPEIITTWARVGIGMTAGAFCSITYRGVTGIIKTIIESRLGNKFKDDDIDKTT